jgi:hypothetical protein
MTIKVGKTDPLKVVAKDQDGDVVLPLPDGVVSHTVSTNLISNVDLATGNFTFTAVTPGDDSLTATVAGVTSPPFVETVVAPTVTTVEIQPQVASVTIQPQP